MSDADAGAVVDTVPNARRLWQVLEPLHGVTYFAPESRTAYQDIGLKGFWMGYFAGRSAPFGAAPPELVTATFFNFRPSMVERALPDAWTFASPTDVIDARQRSVTVALRRLLGADADGPDVEEAAELAERAARACTPDGRALFAALSSVPWPDGALPRLWHAASLLREHRGDGHVAANLAEGVDGLSAHVMFAAVGPVSREVLQQSRGWTDAEWEAAEARLQARGLLADDGTPTDAGRAHRERIEARTDTAAEQPFEVLGDDGRRRLHDLVRPLARTIVRGGGVPSLSPVGDLTANEA